ncbi:nmrA-like family protein [Sarocladium implicatum]|nr:nmrA-like family protein [Sarocladium implicatum]
MSVDSLKSVCLVGANGNVGAPILEALLDAGTFEVSVLRRKGSSSSTSHSNIKDISVSPVLPLEELTEALRGQDVVIASFPLSDVNQHLRLVEAAFRAGVKRFVPADFGSCDASSPWAQESLELYRKKAMVREKLEKLAASSADEGGAFSWTAIICGHFFDYGLRSGLLHVNIDKKVAQTLDGGNVKASASTLGRVAEATVRALQRSQQTKNRALYVQSFCITQKELVAALEKATGTSWAVEDLDSKAFMAEQKAKADTGDHAAVEEVVFVIGTLEADWTQKEDFAMELLGLQDEDLGEVLARVLSE